MLLYNNLIDIFKNPRSKHEKSLKSCLSVVGFMFIIVLIVPFAALYLDFLSLGIIISLMIFLMFVRDTIGMFSEVSRIFDEISLKKYKKIKGYRDEFPELEPLIKDLEGQNNILDRRSYWIIKEQYQYLESIILSEAAAQALKEAAHELENVKADLF